MHGDSLMAPQQPRKPTTIMRAPAAIRMYTPAGHSEEVGVLNTVVIWRQRCETSDSYRKYVGIHFLTGDILLRHTLLRSRLQCLNVYMCIKNICMSAVLMSLCRVQCCRCWLKKSLWVELRGKTTSCESEAVESFPECTNKTIS